MLIAQLSDLHFSEKPILDGRVDTAQMARQAVDAILRLRPQPDVIIITGDLTEHGLPGEYSALLDELVRLPLPLFAVPGNHDSREAFRSALSGRQKLPASGPLHFVARIGEVRLIGLDTLVEGRGHGCLDPKAISFLSHELSANPDQCTLLFMHHPPMDCGIPGMDRIRLIEGADELESLLLRHTQVERLLCGHVHRNIQTRFANTICNIAPATAHQVAPDFENASTVRANLDPPAFLLHRIEGGKATTHLMYVELSAPIPL